MKHYARFPMSLPGIRKLRLLVIVAALASGFCPTSGRAADDHAYIGEWSNGHGDTLVITATAMRFADNEPVPYRNITPAGDGNHYQVEITTHGPVNFFSEKFLALHCRDDEMEMISYSSRADLLRAENSKMKVTWYKDE